MGNEISGKDIGGTGEQLSPLTSPQAHEQILQQLLGLYCDLFRHDGFGEFRIEMRILRRGQKEVIVHCGKQYRYVLDCKQALANESALKHLLKRDLLG
jgi:hypothetical protein